MSSNRWKTYPHLLLIDINFSIFLIIHQSFIAISFSLLIFHIYLIFSVLVYHIEKNKEFYLKTGFFFFFFFTKKILELEIAL